MPVPERSHSLLQERPDDQQTHASSPARRTVLPDWCSRSRSKMRQILLLDSLKEHRNMHKAAAPVAMTPRSHTHA